MPSSLVVQTSFIGDVILSTPLIARLAKSGDVDVITTPVGATVLANSPDIRNLMVYDKRGGDRGIAGFVRTVVRTREVKSDRAYMAQGSLRSAALALAMGYKWRIGFDTSSGRTLYTHRVSYREDWHHTRRLLALADEVYAAAAHQAELQPHLYPGPQEVAEVDRLLHGRTRPFIAMAPGSVWATKRWPYYGELSLMLAQEWDVAIVGAGADAESASEILRHLPAERVVDATGKLSLLGSAELIGRAALLVGNDSAPQHLASAMGTPAVTVFGPTVPAFGFGPLAPGSQVVGRDELRCRPCDRHGPERCPLGHWKCMREIPAAAVYDTVLHVIRQGETV